MRRVILRSGVLCDIDIDIRTFNFIDEEIKFDIKIKDGEKVAKGDIIAVVKGKKNSILKGEKTSLNILQHMSGI